MKSIYKIYVNYLIILSKKIILIGISHIHNTKIAVYPYFIKVATDINKKAHNGAILEAMNVVATNALKHKLGIY